MGLNRSVLTVMCLDLILNCKFRISQGFFNISDLHINMAGEVFLPIVYSKGILFVMDNGNTGFRGIRNAEHCFQFLVFHLYQFYRLQSDLSGIGGNSGDRVSDISYFLIEHICIIW